MRMINTKFKNLAFFDMNEKGMDQDMSTQAV